MLPFLSLSSKHAWRTVALGLSLCAGSAWADAVDQLRGFVRDTQSGQAVFTQTVMSPDGKRVKTSSGEFEFARPNRFRFTYLKPFAQDIVADGQKVWIYDADLNQVSSRKLSQAIGATPAALLAGGSLDSDFQLKPLPDADGMSWAEATPKMKDAPFQSMRVGFKGKDLAAVQITDGFGQRSVLQFSRWDTRTAPDPSRFRFEVPKGADVLAQ